MRELVFTQDRDGYRYNIDTFLLFDFASGLNFKGSVLDVGCGCGIIGILLKEHFPKISLSLLDIAKENCDLARKNLAQNSLDARVICIDFAEFASVKKGKNSVSKDINFLNTNEKFTNDKIMNFTDEKMNFLNQKDKKFTKENENSASPKKINSANEKAFFLSTKNENLANKNSNFIGDKIMNFKSEKTNFLNQKNENFTNENSNFTSNKTMNFKSEKTNFANQKNENSTNPKNINSTNEKAIFSSTKNENSTNEILNSKSDKTMNYTNEKAIFSSTKNENSSENSKDKSIILSQEKFDFIVSNPPFYRQGALQSPNELVKKGKSSHSLNLESFVNASSALLKPNGTLCFCYEVGALQEICTLLSVAKFKLTRLKFVHKNATQKARLALIEAKKGCKSPCELQNPLFVYENGELSAKMQEIYTKIRVRSADL